jgi:hypothetical protein
MIETLKNDAFIPMHHYCVWQLINTDDREGSKVFGTERFG